MRIAAIIPTRYGSTRLPAKALADIAGKPLVQHVWERASEARQLHEVIIATDDERIAQVVRDFGGEAELTSPDHASGTDRIAEVARRRDCDLIVNIQGDEPLIPGSAIDAAIQPALDDPEVRMATLATPITHIDEWHESSAVKVVVDRAGYALYFSRAPIPYFRTDGGAACCEEDDAPRHPVSGVRPLKHIGLYVYTRETLLWFAGLARTPLEQTESLEQLRALENGCRIRVTEVDYSPIGVDTPEDLQRVRGIMESRT
jgi:3-deoxy-manno-octulosonate cytidylyltransferase (CMP-KDO synthetase)